MPEAARIFVSHTSHGSAWSHTFVAALRAIGVDVWEHEALSENSQQKNVTYRELYMRPIFIVVVSPAAIANGEIHQEVNTSLGLDAHRFGRISVLVTAETCAIPAEWQSQLCISGLQGSGVLPEEAAQQVICVLALTSIQTPFAPVPLANTETKEAAVVRGKGLIIQRRYEEALSAFDQALQLDPHYAPAWIWKSSTLNDLKRPAEALALCEQFFAHFPPSAIAMNTKGAALFRLKRYEEALAVFDQGILLDRYGIYNWSNRGSSLRELGRYEEALIAYDQALALDPWRYTTMSNKGWALLELQRTEQALLVLDQALDLNPHYVNALNNKGWALIQLQRYAEATVAIEQALILDPTYTYAWQNKILLLKLQRRWFKAWLVSRRRRKALSAR